MFMSNLFIVWFVLMLYLIDSMYLRAKMTTNTSFCHHRQIWVNPVRSRSPPSDVYFDNISVWYFILFEKYLIICENVIWLLTWEHIFKFLKHFCLLFMVKLNMIPAGGSCSNQTSSQPNSKQTKLLTVFKESWPSILSRAWYFPLGLVKTKPELGGVRILFHACRSFLQMHYFSNVNTVDWR